MQAWAELSMFFCCREADEWAAESGEQVHGHVQEAAQVARVQRAGQEAAAQKVREDSCSPAKKMEKKNTYLFGGFCG